MCGQFSALLLTYINSSMSSLARWSFYIYFLIKMLVAWTIIEFGYITYEHEGWMCVLATRGWFFIMSEREGWTFVLNHRPNLQMAITNGSAILTQHMAGLEQPILLIKCTHIISGSCPTLSNNPLYAISWTHLIRMVKMSQY